MYVTSIKLEINEYKTEQTNKKLMDGRMELRRKETDVRKNGWIDISE